MRGSNIWRGAFVGIVFVSTACGGADSADSTGAGSPQASCKRRCVDDNPGCSLTSPSDVPPLMQTQGDWKAACSDQRPFLVQGVCEDGGQFLVYSTGYVGERRFYDAQGKFSTLVEFTDTGGAPCYGQGYWPIFPKCENPTIAETLCGARDWTGEPSPVWIDLGER